VDYVIAIDSYITTLQYLRHLKPPFTT
jgi:hypothetical protein